MEDIMKIKHLIIIILITLFVSAMPALAQDIHEAAKAGDIEQIKKYLVKILLLLTVWIRTR